MVYLHGYSQRATNENYSLGLDRVVSLLNKKDKELNSFEKRILSALLWSGRATVETRNEQAFLLYAIALESIVLAEKNTNEISYRFAVRIAHLLGENVEERLAIFKDVKNLYTIRSNIVHSGIYEVLDQELKLIKLFTKRVIVKMLTSEEFASISDPDKLVEWFNKQILE